MRWLRWMLIVSSVVAATTAIAQTLSGTYRLVQDSTGKQPRDRAAIDIALDHDRRLAHARDNPVAHRERLPVGPPAKRKFR